MAEEMNKSTYALNSFDGAENDSQYLLVVKNLKKYFPIKSSFLKKTVGNVKAVDGISFKIKRGALATHSSTLAWKITWAEEPGRLHSMGLRRVGHN